MTALRDRVDVIVEAGLRGEAVGEMVWDVSEWDDVGSTWSGVEPTFVALDGWEILGVSTSRGRAAGNRRQPAGTATIELGWRSPAGKWSFRPTSPVALGQEMRVSCHARDVDGESISGIIPIYRGAIRRIQDGWIPDSSDVTRQRFRIQVSLTDRFADLAAVDLPEQSVIGLGDLTDERLARIFDLAAIPTYYLRAAVGAVEHSSSNFARNLLDECQVTVESETGDLYVDRDGFVVFRERLGTGAYDREDDVQLTWANDGDAGSIAPTAFGTGQDLDDVVNQVSMARTGGTAYTAGGPSTDSALRYGLRTYQRFDLTCRYDADVEYCADFWLAQQQDRTQRIDQLGAQVNPEMPDAELLALLDIELRDRHLVRWTDGDAVLEGALHVQGVSHRISGSTWTIGVNLWAYAGDGLSQAPARWDSGIWSVDVWG